MLAVRQIGLLVRRNYKVCECVKIGTYGIGEQLPHSYSQVYCRLAECSASLDMISS